MHGAPVPTCAFSGHHGADRQRLLPITDQEGNLMFSRLAVALVASSRVEYPPRRPTWSFLPLCRRQWLSVWWDARRPHSQLEAGFRWFVKLQQNGPWSQLVPANFRVGVLLPCPLFVQVGSAPIVVAGVSGKHGTTFHHLLAQPISEGWTDDKRPFFIKKWAKCPNRACASMIPPDRCEYESLIDWRPNATANAVHSACRFP